MQSTNVAAPRRPDSLPLVLLGISRGVVDVAGRLRKQKAKGDSLTARILQENTILRGLGGASASAILEYGTFVRLSLRQQIYTPEEPIQGKRPLQAVLTAFRRGSCVLAAMPSVRG